MAQTLIINLMSALGLPDDKQKYVESVKEEYLLIENRDVEVFIALLLHNVLKGKTEISVLRKTGKRFEEIVIPVSKPDLGNINTVAELLTGIKSKITVPVTNMFLVCWGHGMGYSMFSEIKTGDAGLINIKANIAEKIEDYKNNITGNLQVSTSLLPPLRTTKNYFKFFGEFLELHRDVPDVTALTINELVLAINMAKMHFQAIMLDNCFMQTADTFFALRKHTDYLVAPETGFPWRGYDYSLFNELNGPADDNFFIKFCEGSFRSLQNSNMQPQYAADFKSDHIIFSCIKTANANNFFDNLIQVARFYSLYFDDKINGIAEALYKACNRCTDLSAESFSNGQGLCLVDIAFFLKNYRELILPKKYTMFENAYTSLLKSYEQDIKLTVQTGDLHKNEAGGVSIFFPASAEKLKDNPYMYYFLDSDAPVPSEFAISSDWGSFVQRFFRIVKPATRRSPEVSNF